MQLPCWRSTRAHPRTLWVGSRRLWRTARDGREWQPVSPEFDGSPVTAIEIPTAAPGQVWAGTRNGGIFRSLDDGETWSGDLSGPEIPSRVITRIESHPRTASRLVVTIGGTGTVPRAIPRARRRRAISITSGTENIAHVFLSEDGGVTWRPIDTPGMPDVAYHAAVFETHEPYRLFVACDYGVWMTNDFVGVDRRVDHVAECHDFGSCLSTSRPQFDRGDIRTRHLARYSLAAGDLSV